MNNFDFSIERIRKSIDNGRTRSMLFGAILIAITAFVAPFAGDPNVRVIGLALGLLGSGVIIKTVFFGGAHVADVDAIVAEMPRQIDDIPEDERMTDAYWRDRLNSLSSPGGFVYVIRDITITGNYKIGRSTSVNRRFLEFAAKFPFQYTIIHIIEAHDSHELERVLHWRFGAKRITGSEWFALDAADVAWIKAISNNAP